MGQKLKYVVGLCLFSILISCESKFEEKGSTGIDVNDDSQKEYSMKTQEIQENISKAQDLLDGLNSLLKKIKTPELASMGVSDLLVLIMDSVKDSQVERNRSEPSYSSEGEVYLTLPGLSKECRSIRTRSVFLNDLEKSEHTVSIQTCMTGGVFKKILSLKVSNDTSDSKDSKISILVEKDIEAALPKIDLQQMISLQGCQMEQSENRISAISCETSDLKINDQERIKFKDISYLVGRDPVFTAKAVLYKNEKPALDLVLEIDKSGKSFSKATRIPEGNPTEE